MPIFFLFKHKSTKNQLSHGDFLEQLACDLLSFNISSSAFGTRSSSSLFSPLQRTPNSKQGPHEIQETPYGSGYSGKNRDQRNCFVPGCRRTTKFFCEECGNIPACDRTNPNYGYSCFVALHTEKNLIEKAQRRLQRIQIKTEREIRGGKRNELAKKAKRLKSIS
jgi:hypothetical protein